MPSTRQPSSQERNGSAPLVHGRTPGARGRRPGFRLIGMLVTLAIIAGLAVLAARLPGCGEEQPDPGDFERAVVDYVIDGDTIDVILDSDSAGSATGGADAAAGSDDAASGADAAAGGTADAAAGDTADAAVGDTAGDGADGAATSENAGVNTARVRLIGIDAPESANHDTSKNTPEGERSTEFVRSILPAGTVVYLEKDVTDFDKYGRLLRYVWLELPSDPSDPVEIENKMLNARIVVNGYADTYRYEPDVRHADALERLKRA